MLTQRGRETLGGTTGIIIPGIEEATALEIAEATHIGPGTMPVFGPSVISDEDLASLVRYTLCLKNPRDVGGAPLGHVGPVMEGLVGWLVGLGMLLIFIRWIGTGAGEQPCHRVGASQYAGPRPPARHVRRRRSGSCSCSVISRCAATARRWALSPSVPAGRAVSSTNRASRP